MDNAYLHGFDYDSHRTSFREMSYGEQVFDLPDNEKLHRRRRMFSFVFLILIVVISLGFYALRYIPLFDIDSVTFSVTGGFTDVPVQARKAADEIIGQSMMTGKIGKFEGQLSSLAVVENVRVRRRLFSALSVELLIAQPTTFVAIVNETDAIEGLFIVEEGKLLPIATEDFRAYGNQVFVVEVGPGYGEHLQSYGIDSGMKQAIELASEMGMDEDGRYRIIGRIRYEESLGETFGHMVMDMPAYNSKLFIREPVYESRLHDALRLIRLEHEDDWTRNIALIGQVRYDLYAQSLVSRH